MKCGKCSAAIGIKAIFASWNFPVSCKQCGSINYRDHELSRSVFHSLITIWLFLFPLIWIFLGASNLITLLAVTVVLWTIIYFWEVKHNSLQTITRIEREEKLEKQQFKGLILSLIFLILIYLIGR